MNLVGQLNKNPEHVAVIMDGNGRWAEKRGLSRSEGHRAGAGAVREILKAAKNNGVRALTLYAFSTENWGRPQSEVDVLFELLTEYLDSETAELLATGVRLTASGDLGSLPEKSRRALQAAMEETSGNADLLLNLALSYGSRAELVQAARALAARALAGRLRLEEITEERLARELWTAGLPDPDLLIRTGGELRLSNFLLWQCAYAELYFTETLWPDFGEADFKKALDSYQSRTRRFGLTDGQNE